MTTWEILKIFLMLGALTLVLVVVLFVMKKYIFNFSQKSSKGVDTKVISTQSIMPKKYITIVQVQEKYLVLGVCDNSITLLDKLDELKTNNTVSLESNPTFLQLLKKNMGMS